MTIVMAASANAAIGFPAGMAILANGGSAIDAVVATIAAVEANPEDHSVGFSGLPNLLGEVELDASIMDGASLAAGSVGALQLHQDAITAARRVMEQLPHVLIVGSGATRFAEEQGLPSANLLTPEAEAIWRSRLDPESGEDTRYVGKVRELVAKLASDPEMPEDVHGTVNVMAKDAAGHICCGVSTSGWAWKYPGRLGDSPIIGAGNYADDRYGAAACTGRGEMAQRLCTAHTVVTAMRFGMPLADALQLAGRDLLNLDDTYKSEVNIVAIDHHGNHGGVTTASAKTYIFQTPEMASFEERERAQVL